MAGKKYALKAPKVFFSGAGLLVFPSITDAL
jgi:hypothetical protein